MSEGAGVFADKPSEPAAVADGEPTQAIVPAEPSAGPAAAPTFAPLPGAPDAKPDIMIGLQELLAKEKQALSVENMLMDNYFVERLADKIVGKLGLPAGSFGRGGGGGPAPVVPQAEGQQGGK